MLIDSHGRKVSYLRLSVTDRCNLKCFYCRSGKDMSFIEHDHILTYEEFTTLAQAAQNMDITKLRLTGGEPFVRKDFLAFLGMLSEHCPGLDVRITTNGTLLPGKGAALKQLGIKRINISLDTLNAAKFAEVTGRDLHHKVMAGIEECLRYGLQVKINVVAMKGINDRELPDFVKMAMETPLDVRFIEFMPIGSCTRWDGDYTWKGKDIIEAAREVTEVIPLERSNETDGPARLFSLPKGKGRIGIISPMTNHFCNTCNRLRITSDGRLRTCLFSDKEYRLRPALRNPDLSIKAVLRIMEKALEHKPIGHDLLAARHRTQVCNKAMTSIGG